MSSLLAQYTIIELYKIRYIPEPTISITIAAVVSFTLNWILSITKTTYDSESTSVIQFSNDMFYFGLLPPIIFCSGNDIHIYVNKYKYYVCILTYICV